MIFNTYIDAIKFVLIDCAQMIINVSLKIKDSEGYYACIIHSEINTPQVLNIEEVDRIEYINIKSNFDSKYIYIIINILKEQFNLNIKYLQISFNDDNFIDEHDRHTLEKEYNIIVRHI